LAGEATGSGSNFRDVQMTRNQGFSSVWAVQRTRSDFTLKDNVVVFLFCLAERAGGGWRYRLAYAYGGVDVSRCTD
jgi:hypothetical protein